MKIDGVLERPGARVSHSSSAEGERPIVFIHGAGVDRAMFAAQADAVTEAGFRAVLWDLRGHGQSQMSPGARFTASDALEDLAALIRALRLDRPILVGHSLGGNLAQAFVRRSPGAASGIVVLDATWNTGPLSRAERAGLRIAAPLLSMVPARTLPRMMARASAERPEAVQGIEQVFRGMPKPTFLDVWRATVSLVNPDPSYRTPVPLALVRGEKDRTGNIATAMPRWAQAEGIRERVIPGAGHVVTLDAPAESTAALLEALQEMT